MRGKGRSWWSRCGFLRITPAYAGKSEMVEYRKIMCEQGSPPPMRGKGFFSCSVGGESGITPAYAGKSTNWGRTLARIGDHPRLCGEKPNPQKCGLFITGSPPPMRGKAHGTEKIDTDLGITPAYAGKSADTATGAVVTEDHPRLCGEKFVCKSHFANGIGSPPPMRGKDHFRDFCARKSRITPAYAGKRYTP